MGLFGKNTVPSFPAGITLILGDKHVTCAWWQVQGQAIGVQQTSSVHEFVDHQEGLVEVDSALQELNKVADDLDKVIYGIEPTWMDESANLVEEAKAWLKKITDSLTLEPIGFVVTYEAYIQFLLHSQPHLNTIVVYVLADEVLLTVVRQGKIQIQEKVGRSINIASDVVEALARHETAESIWPAKVSLASASLSGEQLESLSNDFKQYSWNDTTPWSASPLLEIVTGQALAMAVSAEGGRAVTGLTAATNAASASLPVPPVVTATDSSDTPELGEDSSAVSQHKVAPQRYILAGVALGIVTLMFGSYFFMVAAARAVVRITPLTTLISQSLPVEFSTNSSTSQSGEKLVIPATTKIVTVEASAQGPATGVKLVGEAAKGQLTILNKTTSAKTFPAGTVASLGSSKYTLDSEVTVASASVQTAGDSETKTFGKTTVAVTASKIGTEGNIPANSSLVIENFDQNTYAATNEAAFTGGTSREARAVAEEDLQSLLKEARVDAQNKSGILLREQLNEGQYALPTGQMKITKSTFSAKVGDEVDSLTLQLEAEVSGVVYQAAVLREAVEAALSSRIEQDKELLTEKVEMMTKEAPGVSSGSAQVQLIVDAQGPVRSKVELTRMVEQLAHTPLDEVKDKVASIVPITSYQVQFQPSLARLVMRSLPGSSRLTIIVQ